MDKYWHGLQCALIVVTILFVIPGKSKQQISQRLHVAATKNGATEKPVLPCGSLKQMDVNESFIIESPNYGTNRNYPNAFQCRWRFLLSRCALTVSCPSFRLSDVLCDDYMEVKDASGNVTRYCGNEGPSNLTLKERAEVSFRTSLFFNSVGFRCQVICVDDGASNNGLNTNTQLNVKPAPKVDCACGQAILATKIVNGEETQIGEFPWMASLVRTGGIQPFCGASIINSRYILTAAHCTSGRTPLNTEIILNEHNIQTEDETTIIRRKIDYIVAHRNYNSRLDNDIALIRLREAVDFTQTNVVPVCLPAENTTDAYVDKIATVIGWGLTREDGNEISNILRKTDVEVITNTNCSKAYPNIVTPRMLCAYRPETDACQGDSGGPLLVSTDDNTKIGNWAYSEFWNGEDESIQNSGFLKYTQIGIVSFGIGCARKDKPGVYSRITEFLPWIQRVTADGSYCSS